MTRGCTYNWHTPAHGREGNGGNQHDDEDDPSLRLISENYKVELETLP